MAVSVQRSAWCLAGAFPIERLSMGSLPTFCCRALMMIAKSGVAIFSWSSVYLCEAARVSASLAAAEGTDCPAIAGNGAADVEDGGVAWAAALAVLPVHMANQL